MQLSYVVLYVSDLEQSGAFYREHGFTLTAEQHGKGPKHYSFAVGQVIFELYPAKNRPVSRIRIGIEIDVMSKVVQCFESEPRQLLKDPNGNVLELIKLSE